MRNDYQQNKKHPKQCPSRHNITLDSKASHKNFRLKLSHVSLKLPQRRPQNHRGESYSGNSGSTAPGLRKHQLTTTNHSSPRFIEKVPRPHGPLPRRGKLKGPLYLWNPGVLPQKQYLGGTVPYQNRSSRFV
ncbi:hypothetical protein HID58_071336 [Brassica napus]|uniref:Uncharacterized protein n=1 Tax=Brassica napus TaxID=3708 RepID=A0ABQ7Z1B6_BRANA|nr:hypothetical protein HID58_071336 [Brassica napus]